MRKREGERIRVPAAVCTKREVVIIELLQGLELDWMTLLLQLLFPTVVFAAERLSLCLCALQMASCKVYKLRCTDSSWFPTALISVVLVVVAPRLGVRNRNLIWFVRKRRYCDARLQTHSRLERSITIPPFANKPHEVSVAWRQVLQYLRSRTNHMRFLSTVSPMNEDG